MKVCGFEITDEQIKEAEAIIFSGRQFTYCQVAIALENSGVKEWTVACKATERLLKKYGKSGVIAFKNGNWEMCR